MTERLVPEHFRIDGGPKVPYEDEPTARRALARLGKGSKRRPNRVYRCGFCGMWHVGKAPPKGRRAPDRREAASAAAQAGDRWAEECLRLYRQLDSERSATAAAEKATARLVQQVRRHGADCPGDVRGLMVLADQLNPPRREEAG